MNMFMHRRDPSIRLCAKALKFMAAVGFAAVVACAPAARRPSGEPSRIDIIELQREINRNAGKLKTLRGRARISFESPAAGYAVHSQIAVRLPDSAFIKLEALFGLDVASLVVYGQSFAAYVPSEKRVYRGDLSRLRYVEPFGVSLDGRLLLCALTGLFPLPPETRQVKSIHNEALLLEAPQDEGVYRFWVEPHHRQVTRVELIDADQRLLYRLTFSHFAKTSGIVLPQMVTLERPQYGERLTLFYVQRALNVDPRTLHVQGRFPAGIEEVTL